MKRDKYNNLYMDVANIRITYVPPTDKRYQNWPGNVNRPGCEVIRIQTYKAEDKSLNIGTDITIQNSDIAVDIIFKLCAVYHAGRSEKRSDGKTVTELYRRLS